MKESAGHTNLLNTTLYSEDLQSFDNSNIITNNQLTETIKSIKDEAKDLKLDLEIFKNESKTDSSQNKQKTLNDLNDLNKRFDLNENSNATKRK